MIDMAIARDTVMGTSMEVAAARRDRLSAAKAAADRVVAAIDQSCSRFREDSELSAVHRQRGHEVTVSRSWSRPSGLRCAPPGSPTAWWIRPWDRRSGQPGTTPTSSPSHAALVRSR